MVHNRILNKAIAKILNANRFADIPVRNDAILKGILMPNYDFYLNGD